MFGFFCFAGKQMSSHSSLEDGNMFCPFVFCCIDFTVSLHKLSGFAAEKLPHSVMLPLPAFVVEMVCFRSCVELGIYQMQHLLRWRKAQFCSKHFFKTSVLFFLSFFFLALKNDWPYCCLRDFHALASCLDFPRLELFSNLLSDLLFVICFVFCQDVD